MAELTENPMNGGTVVSTSTAVVRAAEVPLEQEPFSTFLRYRWKNSNVRKLYYQGSVRINS
jgi:hypothetical protein